MTGSRFYLGKKADGIVRPEVETLVTQQFGEGASDEEIGIELGCSAQSVKRIRHVLRLLRAPSPGVPVVPESTFRRLHGEGLSTAEIAERIGCTYRTAQTCLWRYELLANRSSGPEDEGPVGLTPEAASRSLQYGVMRPVTVVATISRGSVGNPGRLFGLHLDALLIAGHGRRVGLGRLERSSKLTERHDIRPPGLLFVEVAGEACAAATAAGISRDGRRLIWRAYGKRQEVVKLLRLVPDVRIDDVSYAVTWKVDHADHALSACFVTEQGSVSPRCVRHLPSAWVLRSDEWASQAHLAPYWHPDRASEGPKLGSAVELSLEVAQHLEAVHRLHKSRAPELSPSSPVPGSSE